MNNKMNDSHINKSSKPSFHIIVIACILGHASISDIHMPFIHVIQSLSFRHVATNSSNNIVLSYCHKCLKLYVVTVTVVCYSHMYSMYVLSYLTVSIFNRDNYILSVICSI